MHTTGVSTAHESRCALVLGGNGFIGSHLVDRLLSEGWQVTVLDAAPERYRAALAGVTYLLGSFTDGDLVARALRGVDTVFHLISTTLPQSSNDDPAYDVASNIGGTIQLLEACVAHAVRKMIFVSSGGTVYGDPQVLPVTEKHATDPQCSYGIAKLAIEKYLALFHRLYGLEYVILRPSNPYGPRQNPFGTQGVVAVFMGKVRDAQPIDIWGDGEAIRDFLHVDDLVDGILRAASQSPPSRIFNLGMGDGHSLNTLLRGIKAVTGRELNVRYSPSRVFDVRAIILDITRARQELGWTPRRQFEDGLADTWAFVASLRRA